MRMHCLPASFYCDKCLLFEHYSIHGLARHLRACKSLKELVDNGLIETRALYSQHVLIVAEMVHRGYRHNSPLRLDAFFRGLNIGKVNKEESLRELLSICPECRKRHEEVKKGEQGRNNQ